MKPQFFAGYGGQTTYEYKGKRYEVSYCCDDDPTLGHWNYTPDAWKAQRVAAIGTVMNECNRKEYPPAELAEHFPGYVLARFNDDYSAIEYAAPAPQIVHSQLYRRFIAMRHVEDMKAYGTDLLAEPKKPN